MSRPRVLTLADEAVLREEAVRRAKLHTNKQIASMLNGRISVMYAGKRIAEMRREYEAEHPNAVISE